MTGSALMSQCGRYRWVLQRQWGPDGPRVCWVMLNPSTADAEVDDPTIRRCIHFSRAWGYGRMVVVNLYPLRTSQPAECRRWARWWDREDWAARDALNLNASCVAGRAKASDRVVAAWGAGAWDELWLEHVVEEITHGVSPWPSLYCLGVTRQGHPKHPLARGVHRVPDNQQPVLWRESQNADALEAI